VWWVAPPLDDPLLPRSAGVLCAGVAAGLEDAALVDGADEEVLLDGVEVDGAGVVPVAG
jgi:hypothetical protein